MAFPPSKKASAMPRASSHAPVVRRPTPEPKLVSKKFGARPELTTKQKLELSQAFGIFDPRGSGLIDPRGFMLALRAIGFEPKFAEVDQLIANLTSRGQGETLDFKDFYNLMSFVMTTDDTRDEKKKAFKMFSSLDTGVITLDNLEEIAEELGEDISIEKLQEMIRFADTTLSGNVNYQEFVTMMERPELE